MHRMGASWFTSQLHTVTQRDALRDLTAGIEFILHGRAACLAALSVTSASSTHAFAVWRWLLPRARRLPIVLSPVYSLSWPTAISSVKLQSFVFGSVYFDNIVRPMRIHYSAYYSVRIAYE